MSFEDVVEIDWMVEGLFEVSVVGDGLKQGVKLARRKVKVHGARTADDFLNDSYHDSRDSGSSQAACLHTYMYIFVRKTSVPTFRLSSMS